MGNVKESTYQGWLVSLREEGRQWVVRLAFLVRFFDDREEAYFAYVAALEGRMMGDPWQWVVAPLQVSAPTHGVCYNQEQNAQRYLKVKAERLSRKEARADAHSGDPQDMVVVPRET